MYEIYERLLKEKGLKSSDVSKATGIKPSTLSDWKHGRTKHLTQETAKLIADFLGVSTDYLVYGEEPEQFYIDDEVAQIAQELHDDPDLRLMFMAARDMPKKDIIAFRQLMSKWRGEDIDEG